MITAALMILGLGVVWRLTGWLSRPDPPLLLLTPAPFSRWGAVKRVAAEILVFASLWRADRPCWVLAMVLHGGLGAIVIWHLDHFWGPAALSLSWAEIGGAMVIAGALGLATRRLVLPLVRGVSTPADFAHLALLAALAGAGLIGLNHGPLAALLMIVLPFSKLLHAPAAVLPATRTLIDRRRGP